MSVCSGVSLEPSVVTGIMAPVIEGVVSPIETTMNDTLDIIEIIPIVGALIPDLDVDTATLFATADAGPPVILPTVDSDGNPVGPADDCDAMADSYQMAAEGGLSIGGNRITGLGAEGLAASAGEVGSIAFGNSAATDVTATDSIALGARSTVAAGAADSLAIGADSAVTAANSVALGAGSRGLRGTNSNYAAFGLSATQDSVGEVSIGDVGAERQLTNLAAGSAATDAVNVAQLQGVEAALTSSTSAVDARIDTLGGSVATHIGGGAGYDAGTAQISAPTYTVNGVGYNTIGGAIAALNASGGGSPTGDLGPVGVSMANLLGGGVTFDAVTQQVLGPFSVDGTIYGTVAEAIAGENADDVTYDAANHAVVTFTGADGTRLTNLSDGQLAAASSDAVTGGQLFATNQAVTFNSQTITQLQQQFNLFSQGNGAGGQSPISYAAAETPDQPNDGTPTDNVTFVGASGGPVTVSNVADGEVSATSTQAVNGRQLWTTNQNVAAAQATADQALTLSANSVQYDPGGQSVTFGPSGGPVRLQNVARGVAPTDAVNVQQFDEGLAQTLAQSYAYTDQQIEALRLGLDTLNDRANAGIAGALAAASMPQANERGRSMFTLGVGVYENQNGVAMGYSRAFYEGHGVFNFRASYNSSKNLGAGAGIGWQF